MNAKQRSIVILLLMAFCLGNGCKSKDQSPINPSAIAKLPVPLQTTLQQIKEQKGEGIDDEQIDYVLKWLDSPECLVKKGETRENVELVFGEGPSVNTNSEKLYCFLRKVGMGTAKYLVFHFDQKTGKLLSWEIRNSQVW